MPTTINKGTGGTGAAPGSGKPGVGPNALPVQKTAPVLDPARLKRNLPKVIPKAETPGVSQSSVGKIADMTLNPTREKIREVTVVDIIQGHLFPILDTLNTEWDYILKISMFRQNKDAYAELYPDAPVPVSPDTVDNFTYRTAQWQKSIRGRGLEHAVDLAKSQQESEGDENGGSSDGWDTKT